MYIPYSRLEMMLLTFKVASIFLLVSISFRSYILLFTTVVSSVGKNVCVSVRITFIESTKRTANIRYETVM